MSDIVIERLVRVTKRDHQDLSKLLPQLTERAAISEDELKQAVDNLSTHIFVARDKGRIIGAGVLIIMHIFVERQGRIEDVVVDESYRKKGIGKQIMEYLILAARGKGLDVVVIASKPSRVPAIKLYEKLGFKKKDTNVFRLEL